MGQTSETVALYWDFENLHASLVDKAGHSGLYAAGRNRSQDPLIDISTIMEFALSVGPIAINRAFANWVSFNRYKVPLLESAIELIQIFHPGANAKNGADIKLCLDVVEDMARFPHIGTIIVVGGDSDYMPLSYKVKAAGRTLIGIGSTGSTNRHWARSCHEFKFYEDLLSPAALSATLGGDTGHSGMLQGNDGKVNERSDEMNAPAPLCDPEERDELRELLTRAADSSARKQAARDLVCKAITRLSQTRAETWIQKARLRPFIQRMDPTFQESSLGFGSFNEMIISMSELIETRKSENDHELRLRVRPP